MKANNNLSFGLLNLTIARHHKACAFTPSFSLTFHLCFASRRAQLSKLYNYGVVPRNFFTNLLFNIIIESFSLVFVFGDFRVPFEVDDAI